MQFDKIPDSLAYLSIRAVRNYPAENIWIDGVQVEEGELTEYKPGSPYELNILMNNDRGNCYYVGEKQTAKIKVYSPATANEKLEAAYVVKDFAKKTIKKGSVPVIISNHYGNASLHGGCDSRSFG